MQKAEEEKLSLHFCLKKLKDSNVLKISRSLLLFFALNHQFFIDTVVDRKYLSMTKGLICFS